MIKTELHRHIDGSFRASTIAALSQKYQTTPQYKDEDDVRKNFIFLKPIPDLPTFLKHFDFFQKILRDESCFERLAEEAVLDAADEGLETIEFRYSPAFASGIGNVDWDKGLQAFLRGFKNAGQKVKMRVGLIGIITREFEAKDAEKSVEFFIKHKDIFCGVDLAGDESRVPAKQFVPHFKRCREAGLKVTIHAGEAAGPRSIWDAIDLLGAKRIGHGVSAQEDRVLMNRLQRDEILIECCPWSNYITNTVREIKNHPLPRFLDAGIPCSISTDDPGIMGNTMKSEVELVMKHLGFGKKELDYMNQCARQQSFVR